MRQVSIEQVDMKNVRAIAQAIVERKAELRKRFAELDTERSGRVSKERWAQVLGETTGLPLPWINL